MTVNETITQQDVLAALQQRVGGFPLAQRYIIERALGGVPNYWNPATSLEQFPLVFEPLLRERICTLAQRHLAQLALNEPMPGLLLTGASANISQLSRASS